MAKRAVEKKPGFDERLVHLQITRLERKMIWTKLSWLCFQPLIFRNLYEFMNILVVNTGWLFADLRFNIEMCSIYFRWFVLYIIVYIFLILAIWVLNWNLVANHWSYIPTQHRKNVELAEFSKHVKTLTLLKGSNFFQKNQDNLTTWIFEGGFFGLMSCKNPPPQNLLVPKFVTLLEVLKSLVIMFISN